MKKRDAVLSPEKWWPAGEERVTSSLVPLSTGTSVRIVSTGDAKAPPVMFVHGWGVHSYLWKRNLEAIADAGYRVHAIDMPGHGLSERTLVAGSYTLAKMTAHLAAAMDALGITRAPIIAQSMGGRIAVELALTLPKRVTALGLIGSVGFGDVPAVVGLASRIPLPRGPLSSAIIKRWMVEASKALAYGRRSLVKQADIDAYWSATQLPDFIPAMRQVLIDFDWRPLTEAQVAKIAAPVLVVFGTRDKTVRARKTPGLVKMLQRGRLHWVEDAGHLPNEEAADEVNAELITFLAETR